MKRIAILLSFCIYFASLSVIGQSSSPYRPLGGMDLGVGGAISNGDGMGAVLFLFDAPVAFLGQKARLGIKHEIDIITQGFNISKTNERTTTVAMPHYTTLITSLLLTSDYYFMPGGAIRPFIGAGLGPYLIFAFDNSSPDNEDDAINVSSGGMLRAGVDIYTIRCALAYNAAIQDGLGNKVGFLSLNFSVYIGRK